MVQPGDVIDAEVGDLPDFPSELRSELLVRNNTPDGAVVSLRRATLRDLFDNLRELSPSDRESVARTVCPELAERLRAAEEIVEHVLDATGAVKRAREYVSRFSPDGTATHFRPGENPTFRARTIDAEF